MSCHDEFLPSAQGARSLFHPRYRSGIDWEKRTRLYQLYLLMDRNIDCRFLDELAFNDPLNFRAMCLQLGNEKQSPHYGPENIFVFHFRYWIYHDLSCVGRINVARWFYRDGLMMKLWKMTSYHEERFARTNPAVPWSDSLGIPVYSHYYMEVFLKWGAPQIGWFYTRKIPIKWMIWGTPISGNHHITIIPHNIPILHVWATQRFL